MISIIVACANSRVIGKSNDLPWYLPADLRHFKELTMGDTVVMGRTTFESIVARLGKPLPGRQNIVLTRDKNFTADGADVVHSLAEALETAHAGEVCIIGGAQIYQLALDVIDRIYMTEIDAEIDGDTFFPELDSSWRETYRESHQKDEKNQYNYSFITLEK